MYKKETGGLYINKQLVYSHKNKSVLTISYTIHLSSLSFFPKTCTAVGLFSSISQCLSVEYSPCSSSILCSFYCIFVFFPHVMESYPFSLRKVCYFDKQGLALRE